MPTRCPHHDPGRGRSDTSIFLGPDKRRLSTNHQGPWDEAVKDKHHLMAAEMCKVLGENGKSQGNVEDCGKLGRFVQVF